MDSSGASSRVFPLETLLQFTSARRYRFGPALFQRMLGLEKRAQSLTGVLYILQGNLSYDLVDQVLYFTIHQLLCISVPKHRSRVG